MSEGGNAETQKNQLIKAFMIEFGIKYHVPGIPPRLPVESLLFTERRSDGTL